MRHNILNRIEVILTDLDGTLFDTDEANNLAYKQAIVYYAPHLQIPLVKRITKGVVDKHCDDKVLTEKIQKKKIEYNSQFLDHTCLNKELFNLLVSNKNSTKIYLVTKASPERVVQLLDQHNCAKLFDGMFFCKHIHNKYQYALNEINICSKKVLVFEDDLYEIFHANEAGIPDKNITKVCLQLSED